MVCQVGVGWQPGGSTFTKGCDSSIMNFRDMGLFENLPYTHVNIGFHLSEIGAGKAFSFKSPGTCLKSSGQVWRDPRSSTPPLPHRHTDTGFEPCLLAVVHGSVVVAGKVPVCQEPCIVECKNSTHYGSSAELPTFTHNHCLEVMFTASFVIKMHPITSK